MTDALARTLGGLTLACAASLAACVSSHRPGAPVAAPAQPPAPAFASGDAVLNSLIAKHAAENGVPLDLAHAMIREESGYNARARGRGTLGLMQIKPATARGIGYKGSAAGLMDPDTNLAWGMKYLGDAYRLGGGDTCGTVLRYQGGHRATRMTAASRRYCADVKAIMAGDA